MPKDEFTLFGTAEARSSQENKNQGRRGTLFLYRDQGLRRRIYPIQTALFPIVRMTQNGYTVTVSFNDLTYTITESKKSKLIDRKRFTRFYSEFLRHILIMEKDVIMHGTIALCTDYAHPDTQKRSPQAPGGAQHYPLLFMVTGKPLCADSLAASVTSSVCIASSYGARMKLWSPVATARMKASSWTL